MANREPISGQIMAEVSLARSYPEFFRVTGPLLSLVFRTEDVWQRYNQFIETFRGSQSGFPLLTPTMQAGQDSDGVLWLMGDSEGMCMLQAVTVWCLITAGPITKLFAWGCIGAR